MQKVYLNNLHKSIIEAIIKKRLYGFKKAFITLVSKNVLSGQSFKKIKKVAVSDDTTSKILADLLISYFQKYDIEYKYNKPKRYQDKTVKERVKKYHQKQKDLDKKFIGVYISKSAYRRLQSIKKNHINLNTNQKVIEYLLQNRAYIY